MRAILCVLLLAISAGPAHAFDPSAPDPVTASLIADADAIAPGQHVTVALRLQHDPGWHSYWMVPGDSGLPTRLRWQLPTGISAGSLQWPAPHRLAIGPLVDFGYEGETLLLTELTAAADLPVGSPVQVQAHAQWLMCRDVCVPAKGDLSLTLPVRAAGAPRAPQNQSAFERARRQIPRPATLTRAHAVRAGSSVTLAFAAPSGGAPHALEFFASEPDRIEPSAPQPVTTAGDQVRLQLTAAQPIAPDFQSLRGVLVGDGGPDAGGWAWSIEVPIEGPHP